MEGSVALTLGYTKDLPAPWAAGGLLITPTPWGNPCNRKYKLDVIKAKTLMPSPTHKIKSAGSRKARKRTPISRRCNSRKISELKNFKFISHRGC